jgi:spore germination protein KC
MTNRVAGAVCALLALGLLSGCGTGRGIYANYAPLEALQLIETLGLDAGKTGGLTLSAAAGKGAAEDVGAVLSVRADALASGLASLQDRAVRGQVYFAHTQYLVLGQAFAEQGVGGLFDYVERDIHTRMGSALFVVRDGTAAALVTGAGDDWDVSGVLASVRRETDARGDSHVFDVRETAVDLSEYGAALVCALCLVGTEGGVFDASPGLAAVPDGFGVLKDGRLAGFLDGDEARAASILRGTLGAVPLVLPDSGGGAVSVELRCARPELRCVRDAEGGLALEITARPTAVIAAAEGGADVFSDPALDALTDALNAMLQADLERVVARARAMDADFLALGRALKVQGVDPASLGADWLRTLTVRVAVDTTLTRSYDMGAPAATDGGGG